MSNDHPPEFTGARRGRLATLSAGLLALGFVAGGAGLAGARAADDLPVIDACYETKLASLGYLRVLPDGGSCRRDELPISWYQTGPAGPAGPAGATGAAGPMGPPGPSRLPTSASNPDPEACTSATQGDTLVRTDDAPVGMYVCAGGGWAGVVLPRIAVSWEQPHPETPVRWFWAELSGFPPNTDLAVRIQAFRPDGSSFGGGLLPVTTDAAGRLPARRLSFVPCGGHVALTVQGPAINDPAYASRTAVAADC